MPIQKNMPEEMEQIGGYTVLERLGGGVNGDVYKAVSNEENTPNRRVAIKVLRAEASATLQKRFILEQQLLAELNHSHIVKLTGTGTTDEGLPYFAMELIEGLPITDYCNSRRFSIRQRIQLFLDVLDAMAYVHHFTIHRDLKPEHLIVNQSGVVKLIDFGIAAWIQPRSTGEFPGTPIGRPPRTNEYASPEQRDPNHTIPLTRSSDVFSLGVILAELLTGTDPQDVSTNAASNASSLVVIGHAKSCGLTSDSHLRWLLKGDLDVIVAKALQPEPNDRYDFANEFAEDLRRYLESRPVEARHGGPGYRAGRFLRRNLAWTAATVALLAGMSISLVLLHLTTVALHVAEAYRESTGKIASTLNEQFLKSEQHSLRARGVFYMDLAHDFENLAKKDEEQHSELLGYAIQYLGYAHALFEQIGEHDLAEKSVEDIGWLKHETSTARGLVLEASRLPAGDADLARAYSTLGKMLSETGDRAGAARAYKACASIAAELKNQEIGSECSPVSAGRPLKASQ